MLPKIALVGLLASVLLVCMSCASSSPSTSVAEPLPSVTPEPSVFWGGMEGAECMAAVLRTRAPQINVRATTFQNFDVVYPIVEFTFRGNRVHVMVVSASESWINKSTPPPPPDSPLGQILAKHYRYYF